MKTRKYAYVSLFLAIICPIWWYVTINAAFSGWAIPDGFLGTAFMSGFYIGPVLGMVLSVPPIIYTKSVSRIIAYTVFLVCMIQCLRLV